MKQIISIFIFLLVSPFLKGQGLIINEFSNGASGSQEWVELVVIGNRLNPTTPVNLTGYIFDDNGGNFQGSVSGVGIAGGHIRFGNTFNAVPVGSIIIIYNENARAVNLPLDDPSDANSDSVYVLPGNHSSLASCSSVPSVGNTSYSCTPTTSVWNVVGLRNGGDALQVRTPTNQLFHGFSYGDVGAPFPTFPSSASSWNIGDGGTGFAYAFTCGNWEDKSAFDSTSWNVATPGAPNATFPANAVFVAKLRNGTFDYDSLQNNCNNLINPPRLDTLKPKPTVTIPNVFSPNRDGKNDLFVIDSLEYYNTRDFMVFNRWGNKVYHSKDYANDWDGKDSGGSELIPGTYYYILDLGESKNRTGFLSLFR